MSPDQNRLKAPGFRECQPDWIVIGGGLTGVALAYELTQTGFTVLLLESQAQGHNATALSYAGIAHWSGTTDLTRRLGQAALGCYQTFQEELGWDIQWRDLTLVLTVPAGSDPVQATVPYLRCATVPQVITVSEACGLEPLLEPTAIAGALTIKQGHVSPRHLVHAYRQASEQAGCSYRRETVTGFLRTGDRILGVTTAAGNTYQAAATVVCAGALSRSLLSQVGLSVPLYFTHAEVLTTAPISPSLGCLVMPARIQRFDLETTSTQPAIQPLWQEPGHEPAPWILDAGAVQFQDGHMCLGQISRTLTDPNASVDAGQSETALRTQIGQILPSLASLPANWHRCLVAFSGDRLPLIGPLPGVTGLHVFTGFSNAFAWVPPLAQGFARHLSGVADPLLSQFAPTRFN